MTIPTKVAMQAIARRLTIEMRESIARLDKQHKDHPKSVFKPNSVEFRTMSSFQDSVSSMADAHLKEILINNKVGLDTKRQVRITISEHTMRIEFAEHDLVLSGRPAECAFSLVVYSEAFDPDQVLSSAQLTDQILNWIIHDKLPRPAGLEWRLIIEPDGAWVTAEEDHLHY